MMKNMLIYDIEVFKLDNLIIIKDLDNNIVHKSWNDHTNLGDIVKNNILVGYNNYFYDDYILTAMLSGYTPEQIKKLNDKIILGNERKLPLNPMINSLDCFQQIDVGFPSLKKIEANMGKSIIESKIDFTIDRALTQEERKETEFYCAYDVEMTIGIYKMRQKDYFNSKEQLIEMLSHGAGDKAKRWNTTTISANLIKRKPKIENWSTIRLFPDYGQDNNERFEIIPPEVVEMWLDNQRYAPKKDKVRKKTTVKEFGCNIEFGLGGLHGVNSDKQKVFRNVKLLDVASLYPNLIIYLNALGTEATKEYQNIVKKRLEIKHDPEQQELQQALKLIINSCYGLMNNKYSILYNQNASLSVCILGQICLYDLCRRLAPNAKLININTDGVAFIPFDDSYVEVWKAWEQDYGFTLEEDSFDLFIQKDVNNYIGVKDGKIKTKGGDVGRYKKPAFFKNNSNRIVDIAIVDHLVHGVDILTSILNNLDKPELFMMVLQAGSTYKGTVDANRKQYQKINRVFATKNDGITLYKLRADDGLVRFADAPDKMFVFNGELSDFENFGEIIDIQFYYDLIMKTLERWRS